LFLNNLQKRRRERKNKNNPTNKTKETSIKKRRRRKKKINKKTKMPSCDPSVNVTTTNTSREKAQLSSISLPHQMTTSISTISPTPSVQSSTSTSPSPASGPPPPPSSSPLHIEVGLTPILGASVGKTSVSKERGQFRNIGLLSLVVLAFFWVSGGAYGNETLLNAAPPLYVFISLLAVPLIYSLPIALITAELSTAIPEDGGLVVWVQEACGPIIGPHNTDWVWALSTVEAAVYPVLLSQYIDETLGPFGYVERSLMAIAVVVFVTSLKLLGTNVIVKLSGIAAFFCTMPFVLFIGFGSPRLEPKKWIEADGEIKWPLFLSFVLWMYSGFINLGSLAGEVKNPKRTFPLTILLVSPMMIMINLFPLMVAICIDNNRANYQPGHFSIMAKAVAGLWLSYYFLIGSNINLLGLYNSQVMTAERSLYFFVNSSASQYLPDKKKGSWFSKFFFTAKRTGVPAFYIIFNAIVVCGFIWLPYDFLVQLMMLVDSVVTIFFLYSFLYLRVKQPQLHRPFKLPGGMIVAVLFTLTPFLVASLNLYLEVFWDENGIRNLFCLVGLIASGVIFHIGFLLVQWFLQSYNQWSLRSRTEDTAYLLPKSHKQPTYSTSINAGSPTPYTPLPTATTTHNSTPSTQPHLVRTFNTTYPFQHLFNATATTTTHTHTIPIS